MDLNLDKLVKWFCRKIVFNDMYSILNIVLEIIQGKRPDIKFKIDRKDLPNYRKFYVDSLPPLLKRPEINKTLNYKELIKQYEEKGGKKVKPVKRHKSKEIPPENTICQHCKAPSKYLSYNNGKLKSQLYCKICKQTSRVKKSRPISELAYYCPHCSGKLFKWKEKKTAIYYKCPHLKCCNYLRNKKKLTKREKALYDNGKSNTFTLHYIYREYHFEPADLVPSRPGKACIDLHKAHHSPLTIGLVLTYAINYGMSARMTAKVMEGVHSIKMHHQTVINYMKAAASYSAKFMDRFKVELNSSSYSGDETYLKIMGKNRYTWFVIDAISKAIVGFHLSENRDTKHALITLQSTFGDKALPLKEGQKAKDFIADGNPSYDAAMLHYQKDITNREQKPLIRRTVVGLENLDDESKTYRQPKQLIERLNRTYKFHTRPRSGFKNMEGAVVLTTLFVLFYNYMRAHGNLQNRSPITHAHFDKATSDQEKWCKILELAA